MTNLSTLRNAIQQFDTNLFTPYAIGFDNSFNRLFDYASHQATSTGFPPYNIVKDGDHNYTIEMALAGFSKKDIEVEVAEGVLTVKSIKDVSDTEDSKSIYSGIANRQFTRKFTLSDDIIVKEGELKDGMLRVTLERVIPEEKKPRLVTIK
tara:strand:+ start:1264 stop:1716 length:453 start_codon:yes stop_codon:yes gene_type:complete